jgi:hypothetical protein
MMSTMHGALEQQAVPKARKKCVADAWNFNRLKKATTSGGKVS